MDLLGEAVEMWSIRIGAFCLMGNHYHLLIQTPNANLSRCMRHINHVYTQRFNRRYDCDGQLFRGRFKSILFERDPYLLELVRYIHRNPLTAGLTDRLDDYPWTSHHGYVSRWNHWEWLHRGLVFSMFSDNEEKAVQAYLDFVHQEEPEEIKKVFLREKLPSVLGTKDFRARLKARFGRSPSASDRSECRALLPGIEEIKAVVSRAYQMSAGDLCESRRGRFHEARSVAVYLTRCGAGESLKSIGRAFNFGTHTSVSCAVARMRERIERNPDLKKRVEQIEKRLKLQPAKT
jgi:REP element-mobilizing transposase RayT